MFQLIILINRVAFKNISLGNFLSYSLYSPVCLFGFCFASLYIEKKFGLEFQICATIVLVKDHWWGLSTQHDRKVPLHVCFYLSRSLLFGIALNGCLTICYLY